LRQQIRGRRAVRNLAAGHDEGGRVSCGKAVKHGLLHLLRRTLEHHTDRVEIAARCDPALFSQGAHRLSPIHHPVKVHDGRAAAGHVGHDAARVAADVQAPDPACLTDRGEEALLVRQRELAIHLGRYLRADCVAYADDVRAGRNLGTREADRLLRAELDQIRHPLRPVVEVGHELAHTAQVGRLGQRALYPAHDRRPAAGLFAKASDRLQPVAHAPARLGRDRAQLRQVARVDQQRFLAQRQAIFRELDRQPVIRGLAIRIGDGLEDIQVKVLRHRQVRGDEDAIVEIVPGKRLPDVMGRILHHDVEVGRAVHRLPAQPGLIAFVRVHRRSSISS